MWPQATVLGPPAGLYGTLLELRSKLRRATARRTDYRESSVARCGSRHGNIVDVGMHGRGAADYGGSLVNTPGLHTVELR